MESTNKAARLRAEIDSLSKKIKLASTVYNALDFNMFLAITGTEANTRSKFVGSLDISSDPEFRRAFNDYGARLIAEKMMLQHELQLLESVDIGQSQG